MAVTVNLSKPLSYHHKGENVEGTFVELIAPSFKQLENFLPVKQAFYSAISDLSKSANDVDIEKDKKEETKWNEVIFILAQSSCDMKKIYLYCAELFKSGAALLDGEQKLTAPMIDSMEFEDFDKLVGEYIVNFIAASLLDGV